MRTQESYWKQRIYPNILRQKKGLLNRNPSVVKAVDHVSLSVRKGETLGLVGESGCGKSTLGRTILRLIPATEGQVMYNGEDILTYNKKKIWEMRRKLQIIFQDPYSSLNPRMTVYDLISAPLEVYKVGTKEERREWWKRSFRRLDWINSI